MFASPNSLSLSFPSKATPPSFQASRGRCCVSCKAAASTRERDNYYKLLSVSGGCNASPEEIKKAYRAMALRYHPDLVCDPSLKEQSTRMFVQLNAAYKTLSDPVLRRQYDDSLMGFNTKRFQGDSAAVWQRQILELKRRSSLRKDRSAPASWAARMQAHSRC
ncbi:chaperone protein dnaJ 20, chloroplastic-like [Cucumis melo]|uniref:Chaperone protein dnaJ 20, chloroplastic-like n=1 Tax=Cucumis melo TaxID=3656 RepID=A0A1S3C0P6_CUCME|nr:chaperone protein dnaJ 20, chloroplastic-like [Cucumis melo]